MIGLADCNNFFVSCERSVDSSLEGKAVVVMSNNDGCIVAGSNEAKAMGIKMGQPVFEVKDLVNSGKLIAISGHHLLYRDISFQIHDIFRFGMCLLQLIILWMRHFLTCRAYLLKTSKKLLSKFARLAYEKCAYLSHHRYLSL